MSNNSSLYGNNPPTQHTPSSNSTSLYSGPDRPIPDDSGNLLVRGDLAVNGGDITTTAHSASIFNTNAETLNIGGESTALSLGANTGTTTVNNNLAVGIDLTVANDAAIGNDLVVGNNLSIGGDFTVGNDLCIEGDIITLRCNATTPGSALIEVDRGGGSELNAQFAWDEDYPVPVGSNPSGRWVSNAGITATGGTFGYVNIAPDAADALVSTFPGSNVPLILDSDTDNVRFQANLTTNKTSINVLNQATTVNAFTGATTLNLGASLDTNIGIGQNTIFQYDGNDDRLNRPNFQSTTGNTSGVRVIAPNATTSANSVVSVFNTNDLENGTFININARGNVTTPIRIQTGKYTAGVLGPSGTSVAFVDNATTYATVNPAGPTDPTDLATKAYVDAQELNTTYTIDATSTTGGANFNLVGSDATTDTIKFASGTGVTVTRTDANTITTAIGQSVATTANPTFAGATLGNIKVGITTDNTIDTTSGNLTIAPATGIITVSGPTTVQFAEGNDRAKRLQFQSSSGNSTGVRTLAPNTTSSASSQIGAFSSSDINNGQFINLRANNSGTDPLRIVTGTYTGGVLGASTGAAFVDNVTTYATVNPSGPTVGTDLVTKTYVDALPHVTYNIDASSTTGGANLNLTGSDSTTDSVAFIGSGSTTVTRTDANTITIDSTAAPTDQLVNGIYTFTLNADGTVATPSEIYASGPLTLRGGTSDPTNLVLDSGTSTTTLTSGLGGDTATLTADPTALTWNHVGASIGSVSGTWQLKADGRTQFPSYIFPYADGTANQVLTTDGAGNVSWQLPGGGGSTFGNVSIGVDTDQTISTTSGNLILQTAAGVNAGTITLAAGSNGNITLAPNGTGVVSSGVTQVADGSRVLGQLYATRSTTYTAPASPLTTLSGTNGIVVASSNPGSGNGFGSQVRIVYASGDTTAGTNSTAGILYSSSSGTTGSPSAVATNQTLGTINYDGYATTGWAQTIATTGSGGGTNQISPLQVQGYAVSAFTDSAGTVTNAPMGFRVRGFAAATNLSVANRTNFIDHTVATATYKANTLNIQGGTTTTNYATFASTGHTIGNVDAVTTFTRSRTATAAAAPVVVLRNSTTATTTPVNGDGGTFRIVTNGSNLTQYQLAEIRAAYSTTGDDEINFAIANGDQTGATLTAVTTLNTKPSATTISAGTPSATPGATTVATVASFTPTNNTLKSNALTLQTYAGVALVGSAVSYNRVYGQWQYDATITPAAANTAYAYPIAGASGVTDFANIASVGSTSRIIPGAAGLYKLQFSVQLNNADNGSDHIGYFWWRKNGTDVPNSMGQVTVVKNAATIAGWDNMISSANTTDYWELMYAVDSTQITLPFYAATAFGPATASMFITLVPIGA